MNDLPLVSVVTPSYNQVAFLEKTIRSVLEQEYPRIEYMVVDGVSTDGSVEIIQKYAPRLAWWVSEKDNGQAEAINKGLARAAGEVVAWLNSDDFYQPGAIANAVRALQQHPEAGFVYGDVEVVNQAGETTNLLRYGDWGLKNLMEIKIIGQPAVFMRRAALEKAGLLDPTYHLLLDHQLWLRLAMKGGMQHVPQTWAGAHYHPGSKNMALAAEFGKEAERIVQWMETQPDLAALFAQNEKRIRAGAERLNAFYLFDAGDYRAALKAYRRSLALHPAAASQDWYRILFAALAPLGLEKLKQNYLDNRKKRLSTAGKPGSRGD